MRFITVLELLYTASYQSVTEKAPTLQRALTGIDTLKFLLQIAWELRSLDTAKYTVLSEGLNEAGKQVGGWQKGIKASIQKTPHTERGEKD